MKLKTHEFKSLLNLSSQNLKLMEKIQSAAKFYEHVIANALLSRTSDLDLSRFFPFPVH